MSVAYRVPDPNMVVLDDENGPAAKPRRRSLDGRRSVDGRVNLLHSDHRRRVISDADGTGTSVCVSAQRSILGFETNMWVWLGAVMVVFIGTAIVARSTAKRPR